MVWTCAAAITAAAPLQSQTLTLPGGSVTVPMIIVGTGRAAVNLTINGHGPFVFAIETGAPMILVTESTATTARLGEVMGGRMTSLRADELRVGDATFANHTVFTGPQFLPGIDGLLGLPAYADATITVDYPGRRVTFDSAALPEPDGIEILPAVAIGPFVGVRVEIGGRAWPAVIDTQGGTDISVPPEIADQLRFAQPPVRVGEARVGGRPAVPELAGRLDGDATIGGFTISRPIIHVLSPPPGYPRQLLLGIDVLREFSVSIDQRSHRVRFVRDGRVIPPAAPVRSIGLSISAASDSVVVVSGVADGGVAAREGIRAGDVVLEIAHRPAREFLWGGLRPLVQRGEAIPVLIQRTEGRRSVELAPVVVVP